MFLSKKNAVYFNKPKIIDPDKPRRVLVGSRCFTQASRTIPRKTLPKTMISSARTTITSQKHKPR